MKAVLVLVITWTVLVSEIVTTVQAASARGSRVSVTYVAPKDAAHQPIYEHLPAASVAWSDRPVTLPPGRAKDSTTPVLGARSERPRSRRTAEQSNELAPLHVGPPPPESVYRTLSLPQGGRQVLWGEPELF